MPTVTFETISAITTVTALNNLVYEILKQAKMDKTQPDVALQNLMGKGDNFIQISENMAKRKQTQRWRGKGHGKAYGDGRHNANKGDPGTGDASRSLEKRSRQLRPEKST